MKSRVLDGALKSFDWLGNNASTPRRLDASTPRRRSLDGWPGICGSSGVAEIPFGLFIHIRGISMTDPRNIAHDKKVQQEKKHHGEDIAPDAEHTPQPGKKPHIKHDETKGETSPTDESAT
jgi:hypothetical protein